ncbi:MAG: membrane protein insertion efficiency factor YidD [Clostridia bacterium]|nr:membrane protein insertion efficiency factor YidD [Clostridia bacterium]
MYKLFKILLMPLLFVEFVFLIFYKLCISPLINSNCSKMPTCSIYMMRCVLKFGAITGVIIGTKRLMACTKTHKGGLDLEPLNILGDYKWVC